MKRYYDELSVRSYDADESGRVKPSSLFNYFQEAAWQHAERLGFGYHALLERDLFWVISRIRLQWLRPLRWGDHLVLETWPKGISKLFALRDFVIRNAEGEDAVRATSGWLTLEVESKRPRRPDRIMDPSVMLEEDHAISELPGKPSMPPELEEADRRVARYSDLDVNKHVNNARYVDWVFDAFPLDGSSETPFSELLVQFSGEALRGEEVIVQRNVEMDTGGCYASIVTAADGRSICEAAAVLNGIGDGGH
ncbi:MAG: acyl-[acyl-carrier-protein] thioesterase [Spirochaetota bacterium]